MTPKKRAKRARLQALLKASTIAEARYVRDLRNIAKQIASGTLRALNKHRPGLHLDAYRPNLGRVSAHSETVNLLGVTIQTHVKAETGKAFDRMSATVNKTNAAAVKQIVGIPLARTAPEATIATFRAANIALMQKAGSAYIEQVRGVLENPANDGVRVEELADQLRTLAADMGERGDVLASRAELIARDQTLKLNANLTQSRMQDAGVEQYDWSTSQDERVRPMHAALEGSRQRFDSPPVTNEEGETNNPGEDIQCRCIALPVVVSFDDL